MKGQFVIVRADRAGVFFGKLKEKNGQEVTLTDVRKLYYWNGAAAVEEIAMIGTKRPDDCKFTVTIPEMVIDGCIQVIPCAKEAEETIKGIREWRA